MTSRARPSFAALLAAFVASFAAMFGARASDACDVTPAAPHVVSVKDTGAKGDGKADDTAAIQKAIDGVAGTGGTVYVPNGVYMVRATGKNTLHLGSKMTLKLADRAILKVIPNGETHYRALRIAKAKDVIVVGGTLQGDRKAHKGKSGEWGYGIHIGADAARVTVAGVTARHMWGDGFYVKDAQDIAFCGVVAEHNRRQGLSIIDANRVLVTGSVFRDTKGTRPSAGIDLEPDRPDQSIRNVRIERSKFIDNEGGGIMLAGKKGEISNVEIVGNLFEGPRPILVENAPKVRPAAICENRYVARETQTSAEFASYAEPTEIVALQSDCREGNDMRFGKHRITKKKR